MVPASSPGMQSWTLLFTYMLIGIPIAFLNSSIAKRKGKSAAKFGWLSVIPFVGPFLSIFLLSLTDKALLDSINKIQETVEKYVMTH